MIEKVLITGATGNVGRETIKKLIESNSEIEVIAGVRSIEKARKKLSHKELNFRLFDFEDDNLINKALQGIDCLFLVRPPAISKVKKYILPVIKKAKTAGVNHIVFLSLQGVENNPFVPHYKIEKYIREEEVNYTFLRPSFFMQNLSTTHKKEIKENSEIFIPAGNGKTNFIDVRGIAEIAAIVITDKVKGNHINKAYELTGSESLTYYEIAEILSKSLGRKIKYRDPSIIRFFLRKKNEGLNVGKILVMIGLYTVARFGKAGRSTNQVQNILNREPISFMQFVDDYKEVWMTERNYE
jgi:uncharacterized protein YbjT (DUF2867 family)